MKIIERSQAYPDKTKEDPKHRANRYLASKLKTIASQLENDNITLEVNPSGRKPRTKYRSSAELIIASTAPQAALIQARMLKGDIPYNAELFSSCDSVLDRVMGRARKSVDLLANEEGLLWQESIAKRMTLATQPLSENAQGGICALIRKSLRGWPHRKDNIPVVVARGIDQTRVQEKVKQLYRFITRWPMLKSKTAVLFTALIGIFALLITVGAVAPVASIFGSSSSSDLLVSNCTVTTVSGKFWIKSTSGAWQEGSDGMVLEAGNLIKTDAQSKAVLTFFEGSSITLESNTEIKIERLSKATEGYYTILVRQILGRTWSLVEKMTDIRSRYEIHTPSAVAMVRGTSFIVDVNIDGSTHVGVTEGLVAVEAQGKGVSVPAGYESNVSSGMHPSAPTQLDPGVMQSYPGHSGGQGNINSDVNKDNSNGQGNNSSGQGNSQGNSNSSGQGNSQGNSNSSGQGNSQGNSNSNSSGQGNSQGNSNSSGQGNSQGNSNSNSSGQGNNSSGHGNNSSGQGNNSSGQGNNSQGNSNSSGQGNSQGNSNSSGQGNNSQGNSNSSGQGNSQGNSNSSGQGNSQGNSNSSGQGNNSQGNSNSSGQGGGHGSGK